MQRFPKLDPGTLAGRKRIGAQYNLGVMYDSGMGVPQDNVYAHMWMQIAEASGQKKAALFKWSLAKDMTPADISAAQKLARECVKKNYKGC